MEQKKEVKLTRHWLNISYIYNNNGWYMKCFEVNDITKGGKKKKNCGKITLICFIGGQITIHHGVYYNKKYETIIKVLPDLWTWNKFLEAKILQKKIKLFHWQSGGLSWELHLILEKVQFNKILRNEIVEKRPEIFYE